MLPELAARNRFGEKYIKEDSITISMATVTLEQVNENVLALKQEIDDIKEFLEESPLKLHDEVKLQIKESRKRPVSEFKTQEEMEKKFL